MPLKNNQPDIVVKDYKRKTCLLFYLSMQTDNNISVVEYNKIQRPGSRNWKQCDTLKSPPGKQKWEPCVWPRKGQIYSVRRNLAVQYMKYMEKNALCGTAHLLLLLMWLKNITEKK